MAAAHADGHKRRRKAPQKHTSENGLGKLTLVAEELAASHALRFSPPSPRYLLNPREVASEGGGGKGQNSDHHDATTYIL